MLVAGLEIDVAKLLIKVSYERAFNTSTTYPFACLIFLFCRDARVPLWHCDTLYSPVDIGLIRDKENVEESRRGPRVELQPLS